MPLIQIESVTPDGLGMLPLGLFEDRPFRILRPTAEPAPAGRSLLDLLHWPKPAPAPVPAPQPRGNSGIVPPWLRGGWLGLPFRRFPGGPWVRMQPNGLPGNTGIVPPDRIPGGFVGPVVVDHMHPVDTEAPVGAPAAPTSSAPSTAPVVGAPAPAPAPAPVPVPAPAPTPAPAPVSAATASMFATPVGGGSSLFATPGAPTASSMFATVQGSGSQLARVSGQNALSGVLGEVPEDGGKTLGLVVLGLLAGLTAWGFHLNKAERRKVRRARR